MGAWIDIHGYIVVNTLNGQSAQLHRLIWEEANGPIPEGGIIHHKDGDRLNNELSNLELHTRSSHSKLNKGHGRPNPHTTEWNEKISKAHQGISCSEETKEKIRASLERTRRLKNKELKREEVANGSSRET